MIALSLLLVTSVTQAQAKILADPQLAIKVTYTARAQPIAEALRGLTAASHVRIWAAESIQKEVLLLKLTDRPLNDAMARIAKACGGEWLHRPEGFVLNRRDDFNSVRDDLARAKRLEAIQASMATFKAELAKMKPFDATALASRVLAFARDKDENQKYRLSQAILKDTPMGRLGLRTAVLLPTSELAAMKVDQLITYSPDPNKLEYRMPAPPESDWRAFETEQAAWVEALDKADVESSIPAFQYRFRQAITDFHNARFVLQSENNLSSGQITISPRFVVNGQSSRPITLSVRTLSGPESVPIAPDTRPLKMSEKDAAEWKYMNVQWANQTGGGNLAQVASSPPASIAALADPARNEPLSHYPSAVLLAYAEQQKTDVVACLPDVFFFLGLLPFSNTSITVGAVEQMLKEAKSFLPIEQSQGMLQIEGALAIPSIAVRDDRVALGNELQEAVAGHVSLEARAAYAATGGDTAVDVMSQVLFMALAPKLVTHDLNWDRPALLQMHDLIESSIDHTLHSGTFPFSRLSKLALFNLAHRIFEQRASFSVNVAAEDYLPDVVAVEAMPNGLPADGEITILDRTDDGVTTSDTQIGNSIYRGNEYTLPELAWYIFNLRSKSNVPTNPQGPILSQLRFCVSTTRKVHISVKLSPKLAVNYEITDRNIGKGNFVPYENLPQALRDQVAKQIAHLKKQE